GRFGGELFGVVNVGMAVATPHHLVFFGKRSYTLRDGNRRTGRYCLDAQALRHAERIIDLFVCNVDTHVVTENTQINSLIGKLFPNALPGCTIGRRAPVRERLSGGCLRSLLLRSQRSASTTSA